MKKVLALILACVMVLSLAACGGSDSSEETEAETEAATEAAAEETEAEVVITDENGTEYSAEAYFDMAADEIITWEAPNEPTMKVGLIVPDTTSEFYNEIVTTAGEIFEDAGYEFVSEGVNNDATRGVTAIETWLADGIDAIVIMAQDNTCDDALKVAMEQGVLVVSASSEIAYYHHWLTQDNYDVGYQVAVAASEWLIDHGYEDAQYICVNNMTSEASLVKSQGCIEGMEELLPNGECVGVVEYTSSSGTDKVRSDFDTLLVQYPDTKAIVCMHNTFTLMGLEAVKAAGMDVKDEFAVFGASLSEQALEELQNPDSIYEAEIWMGDQGRDLAEHTLGLLNGESYPHVSQALNFAITHDNVDTYYDEYYAELAEIQGQ